MNPINNSDVGAILAAGGVLATQEGPFAIVPEGYKVEDVQRILDRYADRPRRTAQKVTIHTLDAFLAYYERFAGLDSVIFANRDLLRLHAILDYHAPDAAAWGEHTATLTLPPTKEWKAWTEANGRKLDQVAFAEFIETNLPDVVQPRDDDDKPKKGFPDSATLLEAVQHLEAARSVKFRSKVDRTTGGVQFTYDEETTTGSAQRGALKMPDQFAIAVPPFQGSDKYLVEARLRYRISDQGQLTLWYDLARPDAVREAAFEDVLAKVREATDPDRLFLGAPGA